MPKATITITGDGLYYTAEISHATAAQLIAYIEKVEEHTNHDS